jgi:hypothetical protein
MTRTSLTYTTDLPRASTKAVLLPIMQTLRERGNIAPISS